MAAHRSTCLSLAALLMLVGFIVSASAVSAQSVPATAREAAKLPQFANRLVHAAGMAQQGSPASSTAQHRAAMRGRAERSGLMAAFERSYLPPDTLYSNGPINGTTDAWTINFGFVTTDSFPASANAQVTGLSFGAWLFPGDVLQSVEVKIGSSPFGGDISNQVVSLTQSNCSGNQYGFNVCVASGNLATVNLSGATYWVSLQNATDNTGDPVYWDENSGPSMAEENSVGTIPSEAFTLQGNGQGPPPPQCYTSQGNLQIIHSFTEQENGPYGPAGVAIDDAGNLYGVNPYGGDSGVGFAYKLSRLTNWLLDPLFNFVGGNDGGFPGGVIVGANGSLYGAAQGGILNCSGGQPCGLIFNLRPQPTFCSTALCGWTENVLYRFTSEEDVGFGGFNLSAHDQQGNLYGTTVTGGAFDGGTVFQLKRSGAGWTKSTLYNFTGGSDGQYPSQVLVGPDGNLYGVAGGGVVHNSGVVFELTSSGGQWTESVIHDFSHDSFHPVGILAEDSAGNLYGTTLPNGLFTLQKTNSGWVLSEISVEHYYTDLFVNLTSDAAGNLYGTGQYFIGTAAGSIGALDRSESASRAPRIPNSYIFKASYAGGVWQYQDQVVLGNIIFSTSGSLALDSSGNLYGTTAYCGANNAGTVWQLSP